MRVSLKALVGAFLAMVTSFTVAAPPLTTDDAGTLASGACQLEFERRHFRALDETVVAAACGAPWDTEWGIESQRATEKGGATARALGFGVKKIVTLSPQWAIGAAAGVLRASAGVGVVERSLTALGTLQAGESAWHANLGVVDDRSAASVRRHRTTWALANETELPLRMTFAAEVFGQQRVAPSLQLGLRWWMVPKTVQITTSVGGQRGQGQDGRWVSAGIRFETGG